MGFRLRWGGGLKQRGCGSWERRRRGDDGPHNGRRRHCVPGWGERGAGGDVVVGLDPIGIPHQTARFILRVEESFGVQTVGIRVPPTRVRLSHAETAS